MQREYEANNQDTRILDTIETMWVQKLIDNGALMPNTKTEAPAVPVVNAQSEATRKALAHIDELLKLHAIEKDKKEALAEGNALVLPSKNSDKLSLDSNLSMDSDSDHSDSFEEANDADANKGTSVVCMYDKVQRTKTRWRCQFRGVILRVGNYEIAAKLCDADLSW